MEMRDLDGFGSSRSRCAGLERRCYEPIWCGEFEFWERLLKVVDGESGNVVNDAGAASC